MATPSLLIQRFVTHGWLNGTDNGCRNWKPLCGIHFDSQEDANAAVQGVPVPYDGANDEESGRYMVRFNGVNAIDFVGSIPPSLLPHHLLDGYRKWLKVPYPEDPCLFVKNDHAAVTPTKARPSDVGYDLTVIRKVKDLNSVTALYDTGIQVQPPHGYYTEIMPRSSISKSGYMLANSVGIVDASYTGNLMVALTRVDREAPQPTLPFKCAQLIFRRQEYVDMREVPALGCTQRGAGGFGSTGN